MVPPIHAFSQLSPKSNCDPNFATRYKISPPALIFTFQVSAQGQALQKNTELRKNMYPICITRHGSFRIKNVDSLYKLNPDIVLGILKLKLLH